MFGSIFKVLKNIFFRTSKHLKELKKSFQTRLSKVLERTAFQKHFKNVELMYYNVRSIFKVLKNIFFVPQNTNKNLKSHSKHDFQKFLNEQPFKSTLRILNSCTTMFGSIFKVLKNIFFVPQNTYKNLKSHSKHDFQKCLNKQPFKSTLRMLNSCTKMFRSIFKVLKNIFFVPQNT